MNMLGGVALVGVAMFALAARVRGQLSETDRVAAYYERNYSWPVTNYVPNTPGWKALFDERFRQVAEIEDSGERYEGYIQTVHAAYLVPNFTEHGFGLAVAPKPLLAALQKGIRDGLSTARHERSVDVIDAPEQPLFIDRPDLTNRVLDELKDYAEAWSGMELIPHTAYGFRLYQNQSQVCDETSEPTSSLVRRKASPPVRLTMHLLHFVTWQLPVYFALHS
jgi:hypothetical protein